MIKNFNNIDSIKPRNVYNLFSNFGNIEFILLNRIQKVILIQFENQKYAQVAKDNLNNIMLFESVMRIMYSPQNRIKLKRKNG